MHLPTDLTNSTKGYPANAHRHWRNMCAGYTRLIQRIFILLILLRTGKGSKPFSLIQPFSGRRQSWKSWQATCTPDRKEEKLKKQFPAFYRFVLEHWFTLLRHSDYTIEYHVRPFSVEESRNVFATNPKNLSLEEMFRLALTCTPGSEAYNKIFMTAVQLFPDNPVANLNAACIALMQRDVQSAAYYLEKAPEVPETASAKGVLHLLPRELWGSGNTLQTGKAPDCHKLTTIWNKY